MTAPVTQAAAVRALPKVELHCHLEGCVRPPTLVELAAANGVILPAGDLTELFRFASLAEFLDVFTLVCSSLRTADDLHRITYEALADAAAAGVRYREMFFSPGFLLGNGIDLDTIWSGIRAGLAEAQHDLDIACRMILDIDKAAPPSAAVELVEFAARQDRDELIGVGGDNIERGIDHASFRPAFELAGRHGLHRTIHAGEDGPAGNIRIAIEHLGCRRIDHGVRLMDDPDLVGRVVEGRIPLTVCPISNVVLTATVPSVADHPFAAQRAAGVLVTINSDDPAMSSTTIADDYEQVAEAFGYDFETMASIALDGIEASWAPDEERRSLTARFEREIAALRGQLRSGGSPEALPAPSASLGGRRRPRATVSGEQPSEIVPVIDIGGWVGGDEATRSGIAAAVDEACRTVGFMQVVRHGIDDAAIDSLSGAIDWFFDLPDDVKRSTISPRSSINRGYTPQGAERLSYSLGVVTPADLFEAFNVGASMSDFPGLDLDPEIYAEDIWPSADGTDAFRRAVETWFAATGSVARRMTEIFAVALGLPPRHFATFTDHSIDVLRLNHYAVPPGTELGDELGMGAHTDYGIVTVLWADPVPGLELLGPSGSWVPVIPLPGALLINLGDLLARWSNDRWLSTMHRVVAPRDTTGRLIRRRSAATFHDGNAEAVISTLDPCRDADGGSSYDDVTVAEHLAQKLGGSRGLELNQHAEREAARIGARREARS